MAMAGISCTTRVLLVDVLPPSYPFLPFRTSNSKTPKFQIPFFAFSGPDPPPPALGSPGDVYVAPATNALYACMPAGSGATLWTPWRAVGLSENGRSVFAPSLIRWGGQLKLTDPGLLAHPYFPAQVLWAQAFNGCFGWYAIKTVNKFRRDARLGELLEGRGLDAEGAAKVLVGCTLKEGEERAAAREKEKMGGGKGTGKKGVKRKASAMQEDEGEGEDEVGQAKDEAQKKREQGTEDKNDKSPKKKRAREEVEAPAGRSTRARSTAQHASQERDREGILSPHRLPSPAPDVASGVGPVLASDFDWQKWTSYYAKPTSYYAKPRTRAATEVQEQAAVIARLEAENAVLKGEVAEHWTLKMTVEELKRKNEALTAKLEGEMSVSPVPVQRNGGAGEGGMGQERVAFHPEFLDFMRETFASEAMKSCNSRALPLLLAVRGDAKVVHRTHRSRKLRH
ncbi:hypothetical protein B0H16DRAFT_1602286 [Mycena metata]|uniref:Uncharacterized protein n=1 Tax=Mycena metata TaxID=1033252 RepID=A0AAD7HJR3_9AGAR|nr:hypothetical protein B0H16DRAFT_1602286 [Mycena metata]